MLQSKHPETVPDKEGSTGGEGASISLERGSRIDINGGQEEKSRWGVGVGTGGISSGEDGERVLRETTGIRVISGKS